MTAFVVPEKGKTREVAAKLLALASDPNEVGTTMEGPDGVSFTVTDELYEKYMDSETNEEPATEQPAPEVPKRRGRPPGSRTKKPAVETEE